MAPTAPAKRTPATPKRLESTDLQPAEAGADDAAAEAAEALVRALEPEDAATEDPLEAEARLDAPEVADDVAAEDDAVAEGVLTAPEETTWSWPRSTTRMSAVLIPSRRGDN